MPVVDFDEKKVKFVEEREGTSRVMNPREVNTLLMDMMGIPRRQQNDYRKANKLA